MSMTPIAPHLAQQAPTALVFKESKGFMGDSGTVKDGSGNKMFKVDAHMLTMSDRRTLLDAKGNKVGQLRKSKMPGFKDSYYVGTMDDEKLCKVTESGTFNPLSCNAKIEVNGKHVGDVSGNWRAKHYTIKLNGHEIAKVSRKTSLASLVLDADSYAMELAAGADPAFCVLVTIALDELYHEEE